MKLILGLGNPGVKYKNTKHNTGRIIVENFAYQRRLKFIFKKKFNAWLVPVNLKTKKFILALPETFMNQSGRTAQNLINFYKIKPECILVVHDDADLALGKIKLQFARSSAGHHGIQSILQTIGTNQFWRLRIGIRSAADQGKAENFVLKKFSVQEKKIFSIIQQETQKKIEEWLTFKTL